MSKHLMNFNPHLREVKCNKCNSINTKGVNYSENIELPDGAMSGKAIVVYICFDCKNEFTKDKVFKQLELLYE